MLNVLTLVGNIYRASSDQFAALGMILAGAIIYPNNYKGMPWK